MDIDRQQEKMEADDYGGYGSTPNCDAIEEEEELRQNPAKNQE